MDNSKIIPYWQLTPIELKLHCLKGNPLLAKDIVVYPMTLGEVIDIGYSKYSQYLSILSVKTKDFFKDQKDTPENLLNMTPFELIFASGDKDVALLLIQALQFFLREEAVFFDSHFGLVFGEELPKSMEDIRCVNKTNYTAVVEVIKFQNGLSDADEDLFNPSDESTRKLMERMREYEEIVRKAKRQSGEDENLEVDFSDIVSAVSTKSNSFNKFNIWDATMYQVYDEFRRLEAISGYETSVLAMVNGAKIDNLKHWSSSLKKNED